MISERDFIASLQGQITQESELLVKGIGDDCAVYKIGTGDNPILGLITTDALVEGVHFDLTWHPPAMLGKKAASVNISDIAAMGGRPTFMLLSLAVPPGTSVSFLDAFVQGFLQQTQSAGAILIGGDTVKSAAEVSFSVTALGEVDADKVLYRSGANVGDLIWVSGTIGDSAGGLMVFSDQAGHDIFSWPSLLNTHLVPEPEVELGQMLAKSGLVSSMIDLSDGLSTDLAHICRESDCGAVVNADWIPLSDALCEAAEAYGVLAIDLALCGGEDYRLLFTTPASARKNIKDEIESSCGRSLFCVGEIVEEPGVILESDNYRKKIDFSGFDHFGADFGRA